MDTKDKQKSIEDFKKDFVKEKSKIDYNDFESYFFVDNYFYNTKLPYMKSRFYEVVCEITGNVLKNQMQEMEYYANLKPMMSIAATAEVDVIESNDEKKEILNFYYQLHIFHKKFHQIYLKKKYSTDEIFTLLEKIIPVFKKLIKYLYTLQDKFIESFDKKMSEVKKVEEDSGFESSVYN